MSNISAIPELAVMVFSLTDYLDCVRMTRFCRAAFYSVLPFVWKDVEGIHNLIRLLPDAEIVEFKPREFSLNLSEFSIQNTTRFNLYAAHVKKLEVYGQAAAHYDIAGWKSLITLSRQQALLPTIVSITLNTPCRDCYKDFPLWSMVLASSSLNELPAIPVSMKKTPDAAYPSLAAMSRVLVERCPRIQKLAIFPKLLTDWLAMYPGDVWLDMSTLFGQLGFLNEYLVSMSEIQDLICNPGLLGDPYLNVISSLPRLQKLTVYSDGIGFKKGRELEPDGFSASRQLNLRLDMPNDVERMLKMTPILNQLTTLDVTLSLTILYSPNVWISSVFSPLLVNVPYLRNLRINFISGGDRVTYRLDIYSTFLDSTSSLPLDTLFLDSLYFLQYSSLERGHKSLTCTCPTTRSALWTYPGLQQSRTSST